MSTDHIDLSQMEQLRRQVWGAATTISAIHEADGLRPPPHKTHSPPPTKEFQRTGKLLSALSLLTVNKKGWECVAATTLKVTAPIDKSGPTITVRIAQNGKVDETNMSSLRQVFRIVEEFVNGSKGDIWRGLPTSQQKQRENLIATFVHHEMLPGIVNHTSSKILWLISTRGRQFLECWAQVKEKAVNEPCLEALREHMEKLGDALTQLSSGLLIHENRPILILICICLAVKVIEQKSNILDELWTRVLESKEDKSFQDRSGEDFAGGPDDQYSGDDSDGDDDDGASCLLVRFTKKLAGYFYAGITITRCFLRLSCKFSAPASVRLLSVPESPNQEWEPKTSAVLGVNESFTSFREEFLEVGLLASDSTKLLENIWKKKIDPRNKVYVNAELKMALYYATHHEIRPHCGMIGVSQKACWCCDKYLELLQKTLPKPLPGNTDRSDPDLSRYSLTSAGPPLKFFIEGSHCHLYQLERWMLPILDKHTIESTMTREEYRKLANRLSLVSDDLWKIMKRKTEKLLKTHCSFKETQNDSSDETDSGEYSEISIGVLEMLYGKLA